MNNFYPAILAFACCLLLTPLLIPVAKKIGLTDAPDKRKLHQGRTPLIGGIVIWLTIIITSLVANIHIEHQIAFYTAGTLIVVLGALDDRFYLM